MLTYTIVPPSDLLDASTGSEPDDLSRTYVKIEVTGTPAAFGTVDKIRFKINQQAADEILLTSNPRAIVPIVEQVNDWDFKAGGDPQVFEATRRPRTTAPNKAVFKLQDVEVIEGSGVTNIHVEEVGSSGGSILLPVRISIPEVRINFFNVVDAYITSDQSTALSWDTAGESPVVSLTAVDASGAEVVLSTETDGSIAVSPDTTTTYTLKVQADGKTLMRQLTVSVLDKAVVKALELTDGGTATLTPTTDGALATATIQTSGTQKVTIGNGGIELGEGTPTAGTINLPDASASFPKFSASFDKNDVEFVRQHREGRFFPRTITTTTKVQATQIRTPKIESRDGVIENIDNQKAIIGASTDGTAMESHHLLSQLGGLSILTNHGTLSGDDVTGGTSQLVRITGGRVKITKGDRATFSSFNNSYSIPNTTQEIILEDDRITLKSGTSTAHISATSVSAGVKNFIIEHPIKPDHKLVHACIESSEAAVYYRGAGQLKDGKATIELPEYFDALTLEEDRTVQLTPKGREPFLLSYDNFNERSFDVFGTKEDGSFAWEVKAVRADVPRLEVEQPVHMALSTTE